MTAPGVRRQYGPQNRGYQMHGSTGPVLTYCAGIDKGNQARLETTMTFCHVHGLALGSSRH